jgi:hypothetical protein
MPVKEVTIPHNFTPRDHQLEFLRAPQRFKIGVWNRRGGKSMTALNSQVMKAVQKQGIYYYFLPTYKLAKQVAWDSLVLNHIPKEVIKKKNDSELAIYYKNGSIQRFLGCEDPDAHRGVNPTDVIFDEYSEMDEKIWIDIILPVLRENKGTATFIFTPKGMNHSYRLIQMAKESPEEWFVSVKTVLETKSHGPAEIEMSRKEMPEASFKQEMMCEFLDSAGQFFRRLEENTYKGQVEPVGTFQFGVDLAKYRDWTVITPFNLSTFYVYPQERFNQVDWNLQKARIEATVRRYGNGKIFIDSTGVGDPVVEDLKRRGLNIDEEGFRFTEQSRKQLLENLAILLEQDKIKLPDDEGLREELKGFQLKLGERGKVKIQSSLEHDDRVMSLALAVWQAPPMPTRNAEAMYFDLYNKQSFI